MDYTRKERVRVAFLDDPTTGIGPRGSGVPIPAGAYVVSPLDGMRDGVVMLVDPDDRSVLLAMIMEDAIAETREVTDSKDVLGWARYHRANPHVLSSWGEQNNRMAPEGY